MREIHQESKNGDFPGGLVFKTLPSQMQGAQVQSLVGKLDPPHCNQEFTCHN